jgi:nitroimidazol reductase NimA-like FMN-containing flavoprotein (pyridoxamine 5'-phosphate oxidase superfamily)
MTRERLNDLARTIIDSNRYMALGTADADGHPWVSPVWFASDDYEHFHWVSSPVARHSRNVAARPEVAIAIFDSTVPIGGAQAVYMSGWAEELTGSELERGIDLFGRLSKADVGRTWGLDEVRPPSLFRLYRATVSAHYVLIPGRDPELGTGVDRREPVAPGHTGSPSGDRDERGDPS